MSRPEWRVCARFPGYMVSDRGAIKNVTTRDRLRPAPNHGGYLRVSLATPEGPRKNARVHLLVLEAFHGPRPSDRHVGAHGPDRSKRNNAASNLRWATPEENEADKREHGTQPKGGATRRISAWHRLKISALLAVGWSNTAIAEMVGVHRRTVARARLDATR